MSTEIEILIKQNLPSLMRENPDIRAWILDLTHQQYANKEETESRFDRILNELRDNREQQSLKWASQDKRWEAQDKKWDDQNKKWDDQNKKWDDQNKKWGDQNKKWDDQNKKWDDQNKKWDDQNKKWGDQNKKLGDQNKKLGDQNKKWDDQNKKWDEQNKKWDEMHQEIMKISQKHDRSIGALGARWGLQTEQAFRNALAAILEKSFNVKVLNVNEYDERGEIFGHPDQIELDIIIQNGILIICEIKSSIDKAGMYIFERKARFYEKHHQRKANRLLVISPMIDKRAQVVADALGIETYGDSEDIKQLEN